MATMLHATFENNQGKPVYLWTCYANVYIPLTRTRHIILLSGFGSDEEDFHNHISIPEYVFLEAIVPGTTEKVVSTPYNFEKKNQSAHTPT